MEKLTGSTAQIAWAEKIREKYFPKLDVEIEKIENYLVKRDTEMIRTRRDRLVKVKNYLLTVTEAELWIDIDQNSWIKKPAEIKTAVIFDCEPDKMFEAVWKTVS